MYLKLTESISFFCKVWLEIFELEGREDNNFEEFVRFIFLQRERFIYILLETRLAGEIERPIDANLFNELERDEVENTDFIRPLMFPFFDDAVIYYFLFT